MNSSPTSSFNPEDEVDLFPDSTTHTTINQPTHTHDSNFNLNAAPGELSPPRSEPTESDGEEQPTLRTNGRPMSDESMAGAIMNGNSEQQAPSKPGAGWKNKRANEEYQRAWEVAVDKDFSLKGFGDVMAPREDKEGGGSRRASQSTSMMRG